MDDDNNILPLDFDYDNMPIRYAETDEYNSDDDPADMINIVKS